MANKKIDKKDVPYTGEEVARSGWNELTRMFFASRTLAKLEALPVPTDDLTEELGIDIYKTMMNDPQISASIKTAAYQILSQGMQVIPSHPGAEDPLHKKSVEVADFIKRVIDGVGRTEGIFNRSVKQSYMDILEDIIGRRFQYGNSAAEITYTVPERGKLAGMATLQYLSPRTPDTYQYLVDKHNKVPYLLVWTGGKRPPYGKGGLSSMIQMGWKKVPSSKFFVTTHATECGDPRGTSALRSVYQAWYMLQNIWPEYHKYLVQFASGVLKGTTAPGATAKPDENGNMVKPLTVMARQLQALHGGSYIALEDGNEVEIMWPNGDGTPFKTAVDLLGNQIVKGILLSTLATNTSNNQTRAASSVHKDISDLPSISVKKSLCEAQREQIWRPLIALNFGVDVADELTPYGSLGRITPEDRAAVVSAWSASGFTVTPSQMEFIASELELPLPTEQERKVLFETMKSGSQPKSQGASDAEHKEQKKQNQQNTRDGEQKNE